VQQSDVTMPGIHLAGEVRLIEGAYHLISVLFPLGACLYDVM
jgi:hypothetical protein